MSDPSTDGNERSQDLHHGPMMQAEQDPGDNEYGTPPDLWRRLAEPVDGFDVDPCSGAEPTPIAPTRYTEDDDGLRQAWHGDVFVNPPWSSNGDASAKEQWLRKCRAEAKRDAVDSVVVLLPSDTSTGWFHEHVLAAEIVCFYGPGRLSFVGGGKDPSFGILIPVYGDDAEAYRDVLDSLGGVIDGREVYQPTVQTGLVAGDDYDGGSFGADDTVCLGCDRVFDANAEWCGGLNSEVAEELHSTFMDALSSAVALDPAEEIDEDTAASTMEFFRYAHGGTMIREDRLHDVIEYWLLHYYHSQQDRTVFEVTYDTDEATATVRTPDGNVTVDTPKADVVEYASGVLYGSHADLDSDIRKAREEYGLPAEPGD